MNKRVPSGTPDSSPPVPLAGIIPTEKRRPAGTPEIEHGLSLRERTQKTLRKFFATCSVRDGARDPFWILVIGSVIKQSAILSFPDPTPLFEEEGNVMLMTLIADGN